MAKKDKQSCYQRAAAELALALRDGRALADVLDYFARQLRGEAQDLDGPELPNFPTPLGLLAALRRIDEARLRVERAWGWLPDEAKESMVPPDVIEEAFE